MEVTNKIRPNTIFEPIYEVTHFVIGNRETKGSRIYLKHFEANPKPSNSTLERNTHGFFSEWEGSRRERDYKEELLGVSRRGEMHHRTKLSSHLICKG